MLNTNNDKYQQHKNQYVRVYMCDQMSDLLPDKCFVIVATFLVIILPEWLVSGGHIHTHKVTLYTLLE